MLNCLVGPPLPEPQWDQLAGIPPLELDLKKYQNLVITAEELLGYFLEETMYDSVYYLLSFYDAYKKQNECLFNFFKKYTPTINEQHLTCVGMAMELIKRWNVLDLIYPDFLRSCMLVSCEEEIPNVDEYVLYDGPEHKPKVDKEHVLVCITVKIDGRRGVILADPGFHKAQLETVMLDPDSERPHNSHLVKQRKMSFCKFNPNNPKYVEWHQLKDKSKIMMYHIALIYVAKPYLGGVIVTMRRNLVYNFKSMVGRNKRGHITAGMYFNIRKNEKKFTLMFGSGTNRRKTKYDFALFANNQEIPEEVKKDVDVVSSELKIKEGELTSILRKVTEILKDEEFMEHFAQINNYIITYIPYPSIKLYF